MKEMIVIYKVGDKRLGFRGTKQECEVYFRTHLLAGEKIQFVTTFKLV
jgi:hypothetical protein